MKIHRPLHVSRPEVDRGADAGKAKRSGDSKATSGGDSGVGAAAGDRLETDVASFIDEAVARTKADLATRLDDLRSRREELLARANDDAAIRSAARRLLDSL